MYGCATAIAGNVQRQRLLAIRCDLVIGSRSYCYRKGKKPQRSSVVLFVIMIAQATLGNIDANSFASADNVVLQGSRPDALLDHEFDNGSRIQVHSLSDVQVENLGRLGKVWGFLKYHHPLITSGRKQWDFELLRVIPEILDESSADGGRQMLQAWVSQLGPVAPCSACAIEAQPGLQRKARLDWIGDTDKLGPELAQLLSVVYTNRVSGQQYYVSLQPGVGNPEFQHESAYPNIQFPDSGFQLLALFRLWNAVEYWYPYIDRVGDWDRELQKYIRLIAQTQSRVEYDLLLMKLIATLRDSHANLWSSLNERPPVGACQLPAQLRIINGYPVISGFIDTLEPHAELALGDIILAVDGVAATAQIAQFQQYYGASNDASQLRDIAAALGRGTCSPAAITVIRGGKHLNVLVQRVPITRRQLSTRTDDGASQQAFKLISPEIAYLKVSSVRASDIEHDIASASATRGLIVDLRGYPREFVVFALGDLLVQEGTPFARFTQPQLENPGAFYWTAPIELSPRLPHYGGEVRLLVNENTQSQAEYTTLALRVAQKSKVIGSTTAGADGNVSRIPLPFGAWTLISGIGVFYPDSRPTQGVGIAPDIVVKPTVKGISSNRDEVLEEAIRSILGGEVSRTEITRIANRAKNK
jgi:C-terminal processing protease CtpA/Prc